MLGIRQLCRGEVCWVLDSSVEARYTQQHTIRLHAEEMYPSMLVFELSDSRRTRHIVALSAAHASKLRKRLAHCRKLHIYNDHIFVATHLRQ